MRRGAVLGLLGLVILAGAVQLSADEKSEKPKVKPGVVKVPFGKTKDGKEVDLYVLTNKNGVTVKIMTLGAAITEWWVPDKDGKLADVTLGYDDVKGYESKGNPFFGCIVGRVANRIAKGRFTLDGTEYKLAINNKPNSLHGGNKGFDKKVWKCANKGGGENASFVQFSCTSPDGEEGYPGKLDTTVTYYLTADNALSIVYKAETDKATPVNLTNHAYFNLVGHNTGDILGHEVTIKAKKYTPTDDTLIPTGKIEPVKGTPFDFTRPTTIGKRIDQIKSDPVGYDLNYVVDGGDQKIPLAAIVREPKSGRVLEVRTTEPGIQFYTGNFLDGTVKGKGGAVYKKHAGFCLEAQHYPDAINQKDFPSIVLKPGKTYRQTTVYKFSAK
jgi:aldose 1-epimerase